MRIDLCGVRGSLPATGAEFARVGGNTSCVALSHDSASAPTLVLDAGTGLRRLTALLGTRPFRGTLLLGHLHWDHMIGIPFFAAGDRADADVSVLVPEQGVDALELLSRAMSPPLFPITPTGLRGTWRFACYEEGTFEVEGFQVTAREIPHSAGRTMGLRISDGRSTMAYLSDHAPHVLGPGPQGFGEIHPAAVDLVEGVDLLLHDAQYTVDELATRFHWGHAAMPYSVALAEHAHVRRLLLYHHDPSRTDDQVAALAESMRSPSVEVDVAVEGATHLI